MATSNDSVTVDQLVDVLDLFNQSHEEGLTALEPLYAADMRFRDPLQTLHGRPAFMRMMRRFAKGSRELTFEPREWAQSDRQIFVTWRMTWALRKGPTFRIDGVTHARLAGGLIVDHRDYWDVLEGVAGTVPLIEKAYKTALARLV